MATKGQNKRGKVRKFRRVMNNDGNTPNHMGMKRPHRIRYGDGVGRGNFGPKNRVLQED